MNKTLLTAAVALAALATHAQAAPLTADEIVRKSRDATRIKSVSSDATLTTSSPGGPARTKAFHWWRKLLGDGERFNTLTRFTDPVEVRDQAVLFLEYDGGGNDVLIYLPAYKKVRRVETQQRSASFMNSEFSYADISGAGFGDFHYELVKEEPCTPSQPALCYVIKSTPANDTIKKSTGYSQKTSWIRKDNLAEVRAEYDGLQGAPIKRMESSDFRKVDAAGKLMAFEVSFTNVKNNKTSVLKFTNVHANGKIDDSVFSEQNLSRER